MTLHRSFAVNRRLARPTTKFGNQPTVVDGMRFASKAEAQRYAWLKLAQAAGEIEGLECQPRFPLKVEGQLICTYVADFRYREVRTGRVVVEDVKSAPTRTPVYRLKAKLLAALHGIEIVEVA
jgi:hypothetical protein